MDLKLDAEALRALIGDDEEIKLSIVQGVLETYAKSYIKSIANSSAGLHVAQNISKAITAELESSVGKFAAQYNNAPIVLTEKFRKGLEAAIERQVGQLIRDAIDKSIKEHGDEYLKERVDSLIYRRFNYLLDKELERELQDKVAKAREALRG